MSLGTVAIEEVLVAVVGVGREVDVDGAVGVMLGSGEFESAVAHVLAEADVLVGGQEIDFARAVVACG